MPVKFAALCEAPAQVGERAPVARHISLRPAPGPSPHYNHLLLPQDQSERLDVVLVSPRNPLNIGAAARAMANFGFSRMSVVAPYAAHWREARSAVGAPELLLNAREFSTLPEATADCTLVVGTGTLTYRKPEQRVVSLPDLPALVRTELEGAGRIALVFGPEKHGLTREDLSFCHAMVEIPTDPRQPSMNLGQAVAVCLYEMAVRTIPAGPAAPQPQVTSSKSSSRQLEALSELVSQVMQEAHYSPATMSGANLHDMRTLLRRLSLSNKDARRILGLFRRILWRLNHHIDSDRERS